MDNDIGPIPVPETNYNSGGAIDWQRDHYNEMSSSGSGGFRDSGGCSGFAGATAGILGVLPGPAIKLVRRGLAR